MQYTFTDYRHCSEHKKRIYRLELPVSEEFVTQIGKHGKVRIIDYSEYNPESLACFFLKINKISISGTIGLSDIQVVYPDETPELISDFNVILSNIKI